MEPPTACATLPMPKTEKQASGCTSVTNLKVSGITTTLNLNVSNATTTLDLNVSGITTTSNLNVTGVATVGFITATNSYVSGTSTITNLEVTNLLVAYGNVTGGILTTTVTDFNATGITSTQNLNVLGVSTFVGIATFNSDLYIANSLNVGSGSTSTFLSDTQFKGYLLTVGNTTADEIIINSSITSNLIPRLDNTYDIGTSTKQWKSINVGNVDISSGIITAVSGIVTYYGDGSKLENVISGVGIATAGGTVGSGVTFLDLRGAGISTVTVSSGIATVNIEGGSASTRIDKQSFTVGVGGTNTFTLSQPYTSGYIDVYRNGIRLASGDFTELTSTTIGLSTAANNGDVVEIQSFKQVVNTATNSNLTNLNVSGITTLGSSNGIGTVTVGVGSTALLVQGNARVTGILSVGQGTVTIDGSTNKIVVGAGITIDGNSGIISATSLYIGGSPVTGGGSQLSISTVAPSSPTNGQQWWDSDDGNTYIWYAAQNVWVVSQTYGY